MQGQQRQARAFWGAMLGIVLAGIGLTLGIATYQEERRKAELSPERIIGASQGAFSRGFPPAEDIALLERAAEAGIALAQNNLAVILLRTRDRDNHDRADALLDAAAKQGLIQARYNIAYRIPYRFNTDPALVERQITLLQANVAEGDIPSMALLAARLGYANRDEYVADRGALRMTLLETAAESSDAEYLFQYGAFLWDQVRNTHPDDHDAERQQVMDRAADAFLRSHTLGEPRAAQRIAAMLEERNVAFLTDRLADAGLPTSHLAWLHIAAEAGLTYAACAYVREVFGSIFPDDAEKKGLPAIKTEIIMRSLVYPPEVRQRAYDLAHDCATPPEPAAWTRRAFGDAAIYRAKYRGTWPSILDSRGQTDVLLGLIAGLGVFGGVDAEKAAFHLQRAARTHDYPAGEAYLTLLR
ncbi:MAG: hypothetical protein AAFU41_17305 [Pseudomonadota bacterium]